VAGFARYRESNLREPAFFLVGLCTLHGPMVGLHMVSAFASSHTSWPDGGLHMLSALAVLPWLAFLLLITLAEISTMGGVWWRPEPCRCLISLFFVPFFFVFCLCRYRFHDRDCCVVRGDGLLIAPSLGRLRPHFVCWSGSRGVLKADKSSPRRWDIFWVAPPSSLHPVQCCLGAPCAAGRV
jgi:hypothetical protein